MKKVNKKGKRVNNSNSNPSSKLLKTLETILKDEDGRVNYVFVEEKTIFDKESPEGREVRLKSSIGAPINKEVFKKEVRGKLIKRTYQEILQVFEDTTEDLGADYFVVS